MRNPEVDPLNLVVCGTGGQGNILISRLIGRVLFHSGFFVSIGETFGAAQRGGAVHSSMRISKKRYYGPLIPEGRAHVIVSLEPLETLRALAAYGNEDVMVVSNTEAIHPVSVLTGRTDYPDLDELARTITELSKQAWFLDVTEMASTLGAPIVANIILLGGLLGIDKMPLSVSDVEDEIRSTFPESKVELNLTALKMGMRGVGNT
jgi:indolepyruvate ferredoxin oxidoreductase, beta subunit